MLEGGDGGQGRGGVRGVEGGEKFAYKSGARRAGLHHSFIERSRSSSRNFIRIIIINFIMLLEECAQYVALLEEWLDRVFSLPVDQERITRFEHQCTAGLDTLRKVSLHFQIFFHKWMIDHH